MNEKNIINIWKQSVDGMKLNINHTALIEELKRNMGRLDRNLRNRNIMEIAVAIAMIPAFIYLSIEVPFYGFKADCLLMLLWFIYIIYKFISTRNSKAEGLDNLPLKTQLAEQRKYLMKEVKLLKEVLYWYLLPPYIAQIIMVAGLAFRPESNWQNTFLEHILPMGTFSQIFYILAVSVFYCFILQLNKKAIKNELMPAIFEIEKIEEQL